jgi:hypothetical protein
MSSACSMPTEMRMVSGRTPARACSSADICRVQGGYEGGRAFYDALSLVKRLVNIGDAKSLACHPHQRAGGGGERLVEVGEDVVGMLDADRDADGLRQPRFPQRTARDDQGRSPGSRLPAAVAGGRRAADHGMLPRRLAAGEAGQVEVAQPHPSPAGEQALELPRAR